MGTFSGPGFDSRQLHYFFLHLLVLQQIFSYLILKLDLYNTFHYIEIYFIKNLHFSNKYLIKL